MSRTYSAINNKYEKQPKVNYQEYLSNPNEPRGDISYDMPAELEAELLANSGSMKKQEFRRLARRMRNRNA